MGWKSVGVDVDQAKVARQRTRDTPPPSHHTPSHAMDSRNNDRMQCFRPCSPNVPTYQTRRVVAAPQPHASHGTRNAVAAGAYTAFTSVVLFPKVVVDADTDHAAVNKE